MGGVKATLLASPDDRRRRLLWVIARQLRLLLAKRS
jgi:hypothetical protein